MRISDPAAYHKMQGGKKDWNELTPSYQKRLLRAYERGFSLSQGRGHARVKLGEIPISRSTKRIIRPKRPKPYQTRTFSNLRRAYNYIKRLSGRRVVYVLVKGTWRGRMGIPGSPVGTYNVNLFEITREDLNRYEPYAPSPSSYYLCPIPPVDVATFKKQFPDYGSLERMLQGLLGEIEEVQVGWR